MTQKQTAALMAALWRIATAPPRRDGSPSAREQVNRLLREHDPHRVYDETAPQPARVDLEETQDIPLRDCPRLLPLPPESTDAT
jgi:hypothetical protein